MWHNALGIMEPEPEISSDALYTKGGINRPAEHNQSQSASAEDGNRSLSNAKMWLNILCFCIFTGYSIFLVTFAVMSCQGAVLSNHRGIIYQVSHDDMCQIIFLTMFPTLNLAIYVSNPPPRLPTPHLPPGRRSLQSQPHDGKQSASKICVAIQKSQSQY